MRADTQSDYALRRTSNYLDMIEGRGYHATPLTFVEFLAKPESLFIYEPGFFQIPRYIQQDAELREIEEEAREYVVNFICEEFEHKLLGMQDYVRWAKLFRNRCDSLTLAFWAQVNMHDLMFAKDLEMDDNEIERIGTGLSSRTGTGTSTTVGNSTTEGKGQQRTTQDIDNAQLTDSSTREAHATVVRASDQVSDDVEYNWSDAADNVHEIRNRSGDTRQHMESVTDSENASTTNSNSTTEQMSNNSSDTSNTTGKEFSRLTNKQFMQEKQWAINTARELLPLEWLRNSLRPMFYLLY